jgi:hypothetical protein
METSGMHGTNAAPLARRGMRRVGVLVLGAVGWIIGQAVALPTMGTCNRVGGSGQQHPISHCDPLQGQPIGLQTIICCIEKSCTTPEGVKYKGEARWAARLVYDQGGTFCYEYLPPEDPGWTMSGCCGPLC